MGWDTLSATTPDTLEAQEVSASMTSCEFRANTKAVFSLFSFSKGFEPTQLKAKQQMT